MDDHTFERLEYGKVLDRIAGRCMLAMGAAAARSLRPAPDREAIRTRAQRVAEAAAVLRAGHDFGVERFDDPSALLDRAGVEGSALRPDELQTVAAVLRNARDLQKVLKRLAGEAPSLAKLGWDLAPHPDLLAAIDRAIEPDGSVSDRASQELARLRREMDTLTDRIRQRLQAMIQSSTVAQYLTGDYVTQRNGRNVLPVLATQAGQVPGIIHDRSDTGHTVFIEPQPVVDMGNALRGLASDEQREIERILQRLTDGVRGHLDALRQTVWTLVRLDVLRAAARYAVDHHMTRPALAEGGETVIVRGRHPVLEDALAPRDEDVVPLDFHIGDAVRTIAITGANAGGKTVALKTIGLLTLMAQTGLPVPADEGTTFAPVRQVLVDIGDEQSIEANLSTFSGHMQHIREVLEQAGPGTLVLLDEIGAGTDPVEGGALACAVIKALHDRGATTVVTTHLSQVKGFVHEQAGMENAAVQFDPETLAPTYRLVVGQPGASHALRIAGRLGLPGDVLEEAERLVDSDAVEMEGLLARLTSSLRKAEADAAEARRQRQRAEQQREELEARLREVKRERKEALRRAAEEAQGLVENTRREMEQALEEARRAGADAEATRHLRRQVEEKRAQVKQQRRQLAPQRRPPMPLESLQPGRTVWIDTMNRHAVVTDVDAKRGKVTVDAGGLTIEADASAVRRPDPDAEAKAAAGPSEADREGQTVVRGVGRVDPELDLRGLRVEEGLRRLDRYLNEACVADLATIRIIHGHGTGAMRDAVRKELAGHPLIEHFRYGEWGEGGRGVTIATLT
ncbi:MAG: endonuclease MutS2 [Phycisphaerae bacterium]